jgi:uncharacterized protein
MNTEQIIKEHGFPVGKGDLITSFVGGSELHGIKLEGTDDLDLYGIFIENPSFALGLRRFDHFDNSTSSNDRKNTHDDVDVICYSLRRFAELAAKGNPTILQFLWAPTDNASFIWREVVIHRDLFLARSHANRYLGYANAQLLRMIGEKGTGKHGQRSNPCGYDTKAAMHMLRILFEGIELMQYGKLTLPRQGLERLYLQSVREGKCQLKEIRETLEELIFKLKTAQDAATFMPEKVSVYKISHLISGMYLDQWRGAC